MTQSEAPFNINRLSPEQDRLRVTVVSECSMDHMSGVRTSVDRVARYLLEEGHEPTIVAPGPAAADQTDLSVITTPSKRIFGFPTAHSMQPKKFDALLKDQRPDVVHVASPMGGTPGNILFLGANALKAADNLELPTTAVYQTDPVKFAKQLGIGVLTGPLIRQTRKMHNLANRNLVPSRSALQDLTDWGVRFDSLRLWERGVDTELYNPERGTTESVETLRKQWAPNGEVVVGIVSRLEPEKSIERLAALQSIPNTKFVVVGKGTARGNLEKTLRDDTIFTGELRGEALADTYATFDIFAFTSSAATFGQVLQEAKASGVPTVAPAIGGPLDIIEHGHDGYLFEPDSDLSFKYHVQRLAADPWLRNELGSNGRRAVETRSWSVFGEQLVNFYRESIAERQLQR